jgi:hypothetical protein
MWSKQKSFEVKNVAAHFDLLERISLAEIYIHNGI